MNLPLTSLPSYTKRPLPSPADLPVFSQLSSTDAADAAVSAAATMQQLIDDLPEEIALLDERANVLTVNTAWRKTAEAHGKPDALPGHNYRDLCANLAGQGYRPAADAGAGLDEILSGNRDCWKLVYNGGERWHGRDYEISFHRIQVGGQPIITVTRQDLTEILQLRREKRDLDQTVNEGQAIERRRIGRELHDSTSQLLAAMGLVLGRLRHESPALEAAGLVEEMQELLKEVHEEIRSVSYLAHPPSLKDLGLDTALRSLIEGFGRRAAIETSFEIEGQAVPMAASVESAIYRLVQEALSNVHRHAHANGVRVLLSFHRWSTHVVVADNGVGILPETVINRIGEGVGLASMRSRLAEVGGRLTVRALRPGTAIIGSVPIALQALPARESLSSLQRPFLGGPA